MTTTSAPRWQVLTRHKMVALLVAAAAVAALSVVLVLTLGSNPAASQTGPTPTVQWSVEPNYRFDCHPRVVVSYC
jgi:hypothetical protein